MEGEISKQQGEPTTGYDRTPLEEELYTRYTTDEWFRKLYDRAHYPDVEGDEDLTLADVVPDMPYDSLRSELLRNLVDHDDIPSAVGGVDFGPSSARVQELPSFGRKFSVNELARPLLLAKLLKDESPNSVAESLAEGEYVDELNLKKSVSQPSLSRYGDDVMELFEFSLTGFKMT